jgi:hypothetical protein
VTTREDEIRARRGAINDKQGWLWSDARTVYGKLDYVPQGSYLGGTLITMGDTYEGHEDDAEFIANAPADIDYLLKENQRLWEVLKDIHEEATNTTRLDQDIVIYVIKRIEEAIAEQETTTR